MKKASSSSPPLHSSTASVTSGSASKGAARHSKKKRSIARRVVNGLQPVFRSLSAGPSPALPLSPSSAVGPSLDVEGTLGLFSSPDFDAQRFVSSACSRQPPSVVQREVESRLSLVGNELRSLVSRQHSSFIASAAQVAETAHSIASLSTSFDHIVRTFTFPKRPNGEGETSGNERKTEASAREGGFFFEDERTAEESFEDIELARKVLTSSLQVKAEADEQNEQLRSLIYERHYEKAVHVLEVYAQSADALSNSWTAFSSEVEEDASVGKSRTSALMNARLVQLVNALCTELSNSKSRAERSRIAIWLTRVRASEQALRVLLDNRSFQLRAACRQVKLTGDMLSFISDVAALTITTISTVAVEAMVLFENNSARQAETLSWCEVEMQRLANRYISDQILIGDCSFGLIRACLVSVFQSFVASQDNGLTLDFLLIKYLSEPLVECFERYFVQAWHTVEDAMREEDWRSIDFGDDVPQAKDIRKKRSRRVCKLTASGKLLYDVVLDSACELLPFLDRDGHLGSLYTIICRPVLGGLVYLCSTYVHTMMQMFNHDVNKLTDAQCMSMAANLFYLADRLLQRLAREMKLHLSHFIPNELAQIGHLFSGTYDNLLETFCIKRSDMVLEKLINLDQQFEAVYANPRDWTPSTNQLGLSLSNLDVTPGWLEAHNWLYNLRLDIMKNLTPTAVEAILCACFEEIFRVLIQTLSGKNDLSKNAHLFGFGGLMQFTRDVTFFSCAMQQGTEESYKLTCELRCEVIEQARISYCKATGMTQENEVEKEQRRNEAEVEKWTMNHSMRTVYKSIIRSETASSSN